MGELSVSSIGSEEQRKVFLKHLLNDVEAMEYMLANNHFESGIARIGFEQEFCLVDNHYRPSLQAPEILSRISDPHFTTELARYNLEINMDPLVLEDDCFSRTENDLRGFLNKANDIALQHNNHVVLTGILPSISKREVGLEYMTPNPRYFVLGDVIKAIRGSDFELNIIGVDELILSHSNILFEACNTSFQIHLQVDPSEFADMYNWAQMITGPVLSVCTNSPLLFGRQLWSETRIALFQQSIDMRSKGKSLREKQQRVSFGKRWINDITEIYKDDISRYTLLMTKEVERDSLEVLKDGGVPRLEALNLHNGTIWKWNRPCYGVGGGKPHLRIENRYIPSGPTVLDEVANAALWIGLMKSMPDHLKGNWNKYQFEESKENFYKAATLGIHSGITWDGKVVPANELAINEMIPMAREGLKKMNVNEANIDRYMSIIEGRARMRMTGSRWMIKSFRQLKKTMSRDEAQVALAYLLHKRRKDKKPVHEWPLPDREELANLAIDYKWVASIMSTDLITVKENDPVELVKKIMEWDNIRHVPVEDEKGKLLGLITYKHLEKHYASNNGSGEISVAREIMNPNLLKIDPHTDVRHAMLLMIDKAISCLPVVEEDELVGIVTDKDLRDVWEKMNKKDESEIGG
ncbi:MAG: CBS domain-containing protein [Flavobacteriales bacterium]|nr:CBS domain-containing protein [Flavobacteriales bacterium]